MMIADALGCDADDDDDASHSGIATPPAHSPAPPYYLVGDSRSEHGPHIGQIRYAADPRSSI